jgi:DEAD/DEAH box helicase domain-containing protein
MNALPDRYVSDALVLRDPSDGRTLAPRLSNPYAARITGAFVVPDWKGAFAPMPDDLPPSLTNALRSRGIDQLYSHQTEAIEPRTGLPMDAFVCAS